MVNNAAPRDVDQVCGGFAGIQLCARDEVQRGWRPRDGNDHEVAFFQHRAQGFRRVQAVYECAGWVPSPFRDESIILRVPGVAFAGKDYGAKGLQQAGYLPADAAIADNSNCTGAQLKRRKAVPAVTRPLAARFW